MKYILILAILIILYLFYGFYKQVRRDIKAMRLRKIREGRKVKFYQEWVRRGYKSEREFINEIKERC